MSSAPALFLASSNPGKIREVRALLPHIEVRSLIEQPMEMPEETGETFEANAVLKAEFVSSSLGIPALADDSGLVVDALGGQPGVRSARYAPGSDEDRYRKLLQALEAESQRSARFVCCMALVQPGKDPIVTRGECEGAIATAPSGDGGFGYDPVFLIKEDGGFTRTMAALSSEEKNVISHRHIALLKMAPHFEAW